MTEIQPISNVFDVLDNTQPSKTIQPSIKYYTHYYMDPDDSTLELKSIQVPSYEEFYAAFGPFWNPLQLQPKTDLKVGLKMYFVTFTRNPSHGTKTDWFELLMTTLQQSVHQFITGTIEHMDKNIHCHAYITSKYNLSKDRYKAFSKYHKIDFKKVKFDNGITNYMTKENLPINKLESFETYFKPIIQLLK